MQLFSVPLIFFVLILGCRTVLRGIRCRLLIGCEQIIIRFCFCSSSKGWFHMATVTLRKSLSCVFFLSPRYGLNFVVRVVDLYASILQPGHFAFHCRSTVGLHDW